MYLSKNSRYVFKRATALSPKIFKVAQKNLSIKTPSDDPSKPSLRVNIPKDISEDDVHAMSTLSVGDSKQRSFIVTPTVSSTIDEDLLPKSENEIHIPNLVTDNVLVDGDLDISTASSHEGQSISRINYFAKAPSKDDHSDGRQTAGKNEAREGALGNTGKEPPTNESLSAGEVNKELTNMEATVESHTGSTDPKSLYIIIDVPEFTVQKTMETGSPESAQDVSKSQSSEKDDFERVLDAAAIKTKVDRQKTEDAFPKKIVGKFPNLKKKSSRTKRFDISEIEEPATYVFHLRFNKEMGNKSTSRWRVPEKEVKTRSESLDSDDVLIKITDSSKDPIVAKKVASTDEMPGLKHVDANKKYKMRKNADNQTHSLRGSKSFSSSTPQKQGEGRNNESEDTMKTLQKFVANSKNLIKKNLSKSEPDVSATTPKQKGYSFKFPKKREEKQEKETHQGGEPNLGTQVQKELSASEANSEHQNAKVGIKADTSRYLYEMAAQTQENKETAGVSSPSSYELNEQNINQTQQRTEPATAAQPQEQAKEYSPHFYSLNDAKEYQTQQQTEPATAAEPQEQAKEYSPHFYSLNDAKEYQAQQTEHASAAQSQEQCRENHSPYISVADLQEQTSENQTQQTDPARASQQQEQTTEYYSPHYGAYKAREQSAGEYQAKQTEHAQQQAQHRENYSPYISVADLQEQTSENQTQQTDLARASQQQEQTTEYYSSHYGAYKSREQSISEDQTDYSKAAQQQAIDNSYYRKHKLKEEKVNEKENQQTSKKPTRTHFKDSPASGKSNSSKPEFVKPEKKAVNFESSSTCVSIGCENLSKDAGKFCAAFPPLLSEALKNRLKLSKNFFLRDKLNVPLNNENTFENKPISELSENSILFPKNESEKFDCESLFVNKEEMILNIMKTTENEKATEAKEKPAEGSSTGNENSVDSLTVMKKVKEIVQFDLDNVVKIFNAEESNQTVPSVVLLIGDTWKVDYEELHKQRKKIEMKMGMESEKEFNRDVLGDKIRDEFPTPKYLPPAIENEMKLDSVVAYDPKTDEFFINKDALAKMIAQKTNTRFEEVNQTLNLLTRSDAVDLKGGDSILVFDDETQSWKVDFSILEKREEQMKIEEELTKRSELILETFEQLEKGQIPSVQLPDTKDKKTFDYTTEQWTAYGPEKKTKESSTKSKSPFREPDAEEIRKKNSDLYENLFVGNKKETAMEKSEKSAPGVDPSKHVKKSKSYILADGKQKSTETSSPKGTESTPIRPPGPTEDAPNPPPPEKKTPIRKEDEHFWETFLNMNILPRDIRDIPKPKPTEPPKPSKPPVTKLPVIKLPVTKPPVTKPPVTKPPVTQPPLTQPPVTQPPITQPPVTQPPVTTPATPESPPLSETPPRINEPKFKIRIPFIKEKKIDKSTDTPSKDDIKPKETPPTQTDKVTSDDKGKPALKIPPPSSASVPKENPKSQKTPPKTSSSKDSPKTEPPSKIGSPKDSPKTEPPSKIGSPKDSPKTEPPSKTGSSKDSPKTEPPSKIGSPKDSPKTEPPSKTGSSKESPKNEPPMKTGSSQEFPKTEPPKDRPSTPKTKQQDPKSLAGGKTEKSASATDHYVSDKIIEISRNRPVDNQAKIKIETVKLNITPDKRLPSKVTEINLNKKCEEKVKETQRNPSDGNKPSDGKKQEKPAEKTLYKNLEKYKTPFSDPDYEEKALKIKSDLENNPNLKKLDNWNKTLVLQDIMKPPENIENWLKDETDKMATLLLKVLQEAADGKPKKKHPNKTKEKSGKGNPYDNIRKKQETSSENFLFRVRTVNLSLENDKKAKHGDSAKQNVKSDHAKDASAQPEKTRKLSDAIDPAKLPETGKEGSTTEKDSQVPVSFENPKSVASQTALETAVQSAVMSREFSQASKFPVEITEEIPGPELLKKISNAWKMFPILGSQMTIFTLLRVFQLVNLGSSIFGSANPDRNRRHAFTKLFVKYGPIVNVQGPLSGNVILIHNPEHLTGVFDQDVTASVRSVFDSLEQSRHVMEDVGISVGISTDWTKPEWNDLKKGTIDTILKSSGNYFNFSEVAADSLVSNIRRNRNVQNCVSEDFMQDIKRWSLEGLCSVLLEKSFGFLERRTNNSWNMEPDKLHSAIDEATNCLNKCEKGFQMWRLMSTPSAMGLGRAYRILSSILSKSIYQAEITLKGKAELLRNGSSLPLKDLTFLESMLLNDGMTTDEITCNLVDMILIGTNAMNSAMGFLLYNLAQNVKVQMKLLKELKQVLPTKDCQLHYSDLSSLKYLQACLKETLRLNFPMPIFYRLLQNDILLANYIVPKGTYIVMDFRVSSMKEQIFDDPDKFVPERWLVEEKWMKDLHPFGAFPLCHGPRGEIAKKVVEMQLLACAAKVVRNFQVEYQYGEILGTDAIISVPDKPLKLNFVEREL